MRAEAGLRGGRGVDLLEVAPVQTLGREVLVAAARPAQQPPGAAARCSRRLRLALAIGVARQVERWRRAARGALALTCCSSSNQNVNHFQVTPRI